MTNYITIRIRLQQQSFTHSALRIEHVCRNLINEHFYNGLLYKSKQRFCYLIHWNVNKLKVSFCWLIPSIWKSVFLCLGGARHRPLVLLIKVVFGWRLVWSINRMILTGVNRTTGRKKYSAPAPLLAPPQISNLMRRDRKQVSELRLYRINFLPTIRP